MATHTSSIISAVIGPYAEEEKYVLITPKKICHFSSDFITTLISTRFNTKSYFTYTSRVKEREKEREKKIEIRKKEEMEKVKEMDKEEIQEQNEKEEENEMEIETAKKEKDEQKEIKIQETIVTNYALVPVTKKIEKRRSERVKQRTERGENGRFVHRMWRKAEEHLIRRKNGRFLCRAERKVQESE